MEYEGPVTLWRGNVSEDFNASIALPYTSTIPDIVALVKYDKNLDSWQKLFNILYDGESYIRYDAKAKSGSGWITAYKNLPAGRYVAIAYNYNSEVCFFSDVFEAW